MGYKTYYVFDSNGVYTGVSKNINQYETWPKSSTLIEPPIIDDNKYAVLKGGEWHVQDTYPEPVPMVISRRQARQQLIMSGLIGLVDPVIDAIEDETDRLLVRSFWDDSQEFIRDHPQLIDFGYKLGLTDQQIDDLFIAASKR